MYVVIEYEPDGEGHDGTAVAKVHGPFNTQRKAYEWANADDRGLWVYGFDVEELKPIA